MNTKTLTLGGLLLGLTAVFQLIPVVFGEVFVLMTIFSALPIYILSRLTPKAGITAYIAAGILISLFSLHEGMFFLFTNGILGLSLGLCRRFTTKKLYSALASGSSLTSALCILNFAIGIPVFGTALPGSFATQLLIILGFSVLYSALYGFGAEHAYRGLNKVYPLEG